jgi:6-phosphogluconate dehydrogenase
MQLGFIGLGRMGGSMTRRLAEAGHSVVAWDRSTDAVRRAAAGGVVPAASLDHLVAQLQTPRAVWIMVPAGEPTEQTVNSLGSLLSAGDVVIDGGNTHYKDDVRRARTLAATGVDYVDVGTSGGVWGAERGYCLMIGGTQHAVGRLTPLFEALAPGREGYLHCGPSGAGHFVKMIHNGIEYGLMQSYAEGFDILRNADSPALPADHRYTFDMAAIAEVWRHGSVVSSWLLDLAAIALRKDPHLEEFTGTVGDSGEGRWTVEAAIAEDVPADVLTTALFTRFRSRRDHTFAEKLLSALRAQFGGHAEPR